MFFALPVQNLTLPRAQVAPTPPFEPFLVIFCRFFWPFQASELLNFGSAPNFDPRRPRVHRSGRSSALPRLACKPPLLVVEGFSRRCHLGPREGQILNGQAEKHISPLLPAHLPPLAPRVRGTARAAVPGGGGPRPAPGQPARGAGIKNPRSPKESAGIPGSRESLGLKPSTTRGEGL